MNGLKQIQDAVIKTLRDAGLTAITAYDGAAKRYAGAVVTVAAAELTTKPMAMGGYLGEHYDEAAGTVRELYGRQVDVVLALEVRAEGAAACQNGCEAVSDALTAGGLPSGLRLGEQNWEAVRWEKENQCFARRGTAAGSAYFTATAAEEETGTVLDFILKGVLSA